MLRDLATCPAVTCPMTASVTEVAETMAEADVGFLVVLHDDKPVGVLTDRDIVVRCVADGASCEKTAVRDVMSAELLVCFVDQPVEDLERLGMLS